MNNFDLILSYQVTYPISESITSTLLFVVCNIYGIVTISGVEKLIGAGWGGAVGYVLVGVYMVSVVCVVCVQGELRRCGVDQRGHAAS